MRVYIAGPMTHYPLYNFPAFDAAADEIRSEGHKAINPAELDREAGFDPTTLPEDWDWSTYPPGTDPNEFINRDLDAIKTADAIYMLRGWRQSRGARAEHALAEWRGMTIIDTDQPSEAARRKQTPVASGVLDYFPDAIRALAHCSWVGNEQHNAGEPLHWARDKSSDHADCLLRHFMDRGTVDSDGIPHSIKVLWRAAAIAQLELESK